jgi:hypothetical protein
MWKTSSEKEEIAAAKKELGKSRSQMSNNISGDGLVRQATHSSVSSSSKSTSFITTPKDENENDESDDRDENDIGSSIGSLSANSKRKKSSNVWLDDLHESILDVLKDEPKSDEDIELDLREKRARVEQIELQNASMRAMNKQMEDQGKLMALLLSIQQNK